MSANYKTPITILQEYAIKNRMILPRYSYEDLSNRNGSKFECYCLFNTSHEIGTAPSKKKAKQNAAKLMLAHIGITNEPATLPDVEVCYTASNSARTNYVGKLNEFTSKKKCDDPRYIEMGYVEQVYVMVCAVLQYETEGKGYNKKEAKQQAAKNMLERLSIEEASTSKQESQNHPANEEVIEIYKKLSINNLAPSTSTFIANEIEKPINNSSFKKEEPTDEAFKMFDQKLKEMNIAYTLDKIDSHQQIVITLTAQTKQMKIISLMEMGASFQEVYEKLLESIVNRLAHLEQE